MDGEVEVKSSDERRSHPRVFFSKDSVGSVALSRHGTGWVTGAGGGSAGTVLSGDLGTSVSGTDRNSEGEEEEEEEREG